MSFVPTAGVERLGNVLLYDWPFSPFTRVVLPLVVVAVGEDAFSPGVSRVEAEMQVKTGRCSQGCPAVHGVLQARLQFPGPLSDQQMLLGMYGQRLS